MQLNMQKVQETAIISPKNENGMINVINFDEEFKKLSKNYTLHDMGKIKCFIEKHKIILDYIHEITPLINDYFPNYAKIIAFCEDPEFDELDYISIYVQGSSLDEDWEILKKLKNEPIYMSKFSKNINGLVCVDLW